MKNSDHLKNVSLEDRKLMQEKAAEKRKKQKEFAEANLKLGFEDKDHWRMLAQKVGFRLAQRYVPSTETKHVRKLLKAINKDSSWLEQVSGVKSVKVFCSLNPTWPAFAIQGTLLENYCEELV